MACRTETKEIDGKEINVTQWSAEKALLMKLKLLKLFGPSLSKFTENKEAAEALGHLFNAAEPEEVLRLFKSCLIGTGMDGSKITEMCFKTRFETDNLMLIYKIFIFVMQVNYGNFFKGQLVDDLLAKVKENL